MKKIKFIINPISGVGKQKTVEKLVEANLNKTLFDYEYTYTTAAKHAIKLSKQAAEGNYDAVIIVGGDGSVNEAGQALINTETALGIIPTGSGNGLARHLNIPVNLPQAVKLLNNFNTTKIDTCCMNNQPFLGTAGIGFDAHIGWRFSEFGTRGFLSYIRLILQEYNQFKEQNFKLTIDGKTIEKSALFIAFANSAQYGNNASIAPLADIKDGLIDICIANKIPIIQAFSHIRMLFTQKFNDSKFVEIIKAKNILIKQEEKIAHLDGEPIAPGRELEIKIKPLSLKVIVP